MPVTRDQSPFEIAETVSKAILGELLKTFPSGAELSAERLAPLIGMARRPGELSIARREATLPEIPVMPNGQTLDEYIEHMTRWLEHDGMLTRHAYFSTITRKGLDHLGVAFLRPST